LRVEAFGPFAGVEEVDFDDLAGLFLLHGPTGAGKSSVLDAVCFALYGQLPGARATGRPHLRSDHAAPDAAPRVVLEVTIGGRRLEVTRSPEWQRPKKRGSGTTRQPASTDVRELVDGEWQVLVGRRSDEAGLLLKDLLGMGLDQFTKVVLLPQGEFAAFLRSNAEQRGDVLRRLFDIDRYTDAETWLRDERGRLGRQVAQADAERDRLVARAHEAASALTGAVAAGTDELTLADPPGVEVVQALASVAALAAGSAQAQVTAARTAAETAGRQLNRAEALARRQGRLADLRAQLEQLESGREVHLSDQGRLEAANRAAQLRLLVRQLDDTTTRHAQEAAALVRSADDVRRVLGWAPMPADPGHDPDHELQVRAAQLARATDARSLESELAAVRERLAQNEQERLTAEACLLTDELELTDAQALHDAAATQLSEHQDLAARVGEHQQALVDAQTVWIATQALRGCDLEVAQLEEARRQARDCELDARSAWIEHREQRIAGMAAELAAALEPNVPCAVCGSADHPRPATPAAGHVDASAERDAAERQEIAAKALQSAEQALADASTRRAEVRASSRGHDAVSAKAQVERLARALERAKASVDVVQVAERALAGAVAARADVLTHREYNQQRRTAAASRVAELEPRAAELESRLHSVLDGAADVDSLEARLREQVGALAEHGRAREAESALKRQVLELTQDLRHSSVDLGFSGLEQVREALLDDEQLQALRSLVEERSRLETQLRALLSDGDLDGVDEQPAPDLAALRAAHEQCAVELGECTERHAVAAQASRALTRLAEQLTAHEGVHHDLRRRAAHVDELSRCVDGTGGGNSLRMRLSSFVLAARLEDVAAAATERLAVMSDGRYTLAHTDELARSGARSGLGLHVVDSWTGVARETNTLSGGETFLASLALALGLADVVQAAAGGTTIETLFVDEGFGTLDEDALEEVLGVLDSLRDGGRAVGLVSHVRELRDRIPDQVEIKRTRSGSSVHQRSALAS
jgi:exonuclease SbcC